ncbi:MAG TPA: carboxypeptidase-like regulatory domain-containing protein [Candidatus Limnocylindria bacterium]|nr:carboxypeptidase-like regulatory domain-containing protein [Candidatus Limnocylindria bacterium]
MRALIVSTLLVCALTSAPAAAQTLTYIEGYVREAGGAEDPVPIADVCVTLGPPTGCTAATNADGYYRIDGVPASPTQQWELIFSKQGYQTGRTGLFTVPGPKRVDAFLPRGQGNCSRPDTPRTTVYLPNITKTLGGPSGFVTPFIVQNTSPGLITSLQIEFYRFSDGALITRRELCVLRPGTSFADVPNNDIDLPHDTQFSVVVRSFMTDVVAVVNEHAGSGGSAESASYIGASAGATSVFLPNITRRFFGFFTPFIIQNLGSATATATAEFVSFDGAQRRSVVRTIGPGRSQFIDPNLEPGLTDGTQYAVTVTASQPLSVVVNTHCLATSSACSPGGSPLFYATNGITAGASTIYGPYAVKNVEGVGQGVSPIVVQNLGSAAVAPTLAFRPLGGGTVTTFTGPSVAPGASWAFDPRFVNGSSAQGTCGAAASAGCLANGEYSFVASAAGGSLAAVVNVISAFTASGYAALAQPAQRVYLPNVTRRLGGATGWSTPVVIQSAGATSATLSWYRFSDGSLVTTTSVSFSNGVAANVDPRSVPGLSDETQYSVVAQGAGGNIVGIVRELNFQGGDGAMTYEGFGR